MQYDDSEAYDWYFEWERLNKQRTRKLRIWAISFVVVVAVAVLSTVFLCTIN